MSDAISQLFKVLESGGPGDVHVYTPRGIAPTRNAVVENLAEDCIVGGAHHFPVSPAQDNCDKLDALLTHY
jgi:hypothetical protein